MTFTIRPSAVTLARRSFAKAGIAAGLLRPEKVTDAEGVGLVAHEPQPGEVVVVELEDRLVGAHVAQDDVDRVSGGRLGEEAVEAGDDARRAGQRIDVDDALQAE